MIGQCRERREEGLELRRTEQAERTQRRKRMTFLLERADDLDQAAKLARLAAHLRATDEGTSPMLADILESCDAYAAELRKSSAANAVSRDAAEWRIW